MAGHPDRKFANDIMTYIDKGVPTFFHGPSLAHVYKNWKSCRDLSREVSEIIRGEVLKGRKIGPFIYKPFVNFVGSPMGAIQKP